MNIRKRAWNQRIFGVLALNSWRLKKEDGAIYDELDFQVITVKTTRSWLVNLSINCNMCFWIGCILGGGCPLGVADSQQQLISAAVSTVSYCCNDGNIHLQYLCLHTTCL